MPRNSIRWGAWASIFGALSFIVVVATLHTLQPGYDPSAQLMSELALGPHGWAMLIAFCGLALGTAGIALAIASMGASPILTSLLAASSFFFLVSGVFPLGETSTIHIAAIATAFVFSVLAMYFFPALGGDARALAGRGLSWSCAAGVAASVALGHSALPMGIGQRLAAGFLLLWIVAVGWRLRGASPT
jgi:hypothetical membrane protein